MKSCHEINACRRLHQYLAEGRNGRRLSAGHKADFESRFRCQLGTVRIHRHALAAALCADFNARALTIGEDILFGEDEFCPQSRRGRQLIAHELTHVIQQRMIGNQDRCDSLGMVAAGDDACEIEAQTLAQQIDGGARSVRVCCPSPRRIQRQFKIDTSSAGFKVITGQVNANAATDLITNRKVMAFNLRNGFDFTQLNQTSHAFEMNGHVKVSFDRTDNPRALTFGIIQFMRQKQMRLVYAGRDESEGHIEIDELSALGSDFFHDRLDRQAGITPFVSIASQFDAGTGEVTCPFGDGPGSVVDEVVWNTSTNAKNFLFEATDAREAWTLLVVKNELGKFQVLSSLHWDVDYFARFQWREGSCLPKVDTSSFAMGTSNVGGPNEPRLNRFLSNLGPRMGAAYNTAVKAAVTQAIAPPPSTFRKDLTNFDGVNVPDLFFLDFKGAIDIL